VVRQPMDDPQLVLVEAWDRDQPGLRAGTPAKTALRDQRRLPAPLPAPDDTIEWRDRLVLTVREAAELLGISKDLAYELIARGELPALRLGRRVVVPTRALRSLAGDE